MASNKKKTQNIVTIVVAALALVLLGLVILVKTGVLTKDKEEDDYVETETRVYETSEINEDGEIVYYTMVESYVKPGISSNHRYPVTTRKYTTTEPQETEPEEDEYYIEVTEVETAVDEEGNPLLDENGEPVTNVVTYTIPSDKDGNILTEPAESIDENDESSSEEVPTEPETTESTAEYLSIGGKAVTKRNGEPVTVKKVTNPIDKIRKKKTTTSAPAETQAMPESGSAGEGSEASSSASSNVSKSGEKTTASGSKPAVPESTTVKPGTSKSEEKTTASGGGTVRQSTTVQTSKTVELSTSNVTNEDVRGGFDWFTPSATEAPTEAPVYQTEQDLTVTLPSEENILQ